MSRDTRSRYRHSREKGHRDRGRLSEEAPGMRPIFREKTYDGELSVG